MVTVYGHGERVSEGTELIVNVLILGNDAKGGCLIAQERYDISLLQRQRQPVVLHFVELKQLVDESQHAVCTFLHLCYRKLQVGRQVLHLLGAVDSRLDDGQ